MKWVNHGTRSLSSVPRDGDVHLGLESVQRNPALTRILLVAMPLSLPRPPLNYSFTGGGHRTLSPARLDARLHRRQHFSHHRVSRGESRPGKRCIRPLATRFASHCAFAFVAANFHLAALESVEVQALGSVREGSGLLIGCVRFIDGMTYVCTVNNTSRLCS
jgi:hypothetical protein